MEHAGPAAPGRAAPPAEPRDPAAGAPAPAADSAAHIAAAPVTAAALRSPRMAQRTDASQDEARSLGSALEAAARLFPCGAILVQPAGAQGGGSGRGLPQPLLASETSAWSTPLAAGHSATATRASHAAAEAAGAAVPVQPRRSARQTGGARLTMIGGPLAREERSEHADVVSVVNSGCLTRS